MNGSQVISRTKEQITDEAISECKCKRIETGTVILSFKLSIGKVAITGTPLYTNEAIAALKIRDNRKLDTKYLYHYLKSQDLTVDTDRAAKGKTLNLAKLERIKVSVPPLPEQKRIAAILDKADAIRRKREKAIELTDSFLRSVFLEIFGDPIQNPKKWKKSPLGNHVISLDGGKNFKTDDSESEATRFKILKVSAVTKGVYDPSESKPVPVGFTPPEGYFVKKGDLLISRANTRELIGATAFVWETPSNIILPDKIWRFKWRKPEDISPLYFHFLLQHPMIRAEIGRRSSGTSGSMKNIAKPKLLSIEVPNPPIQLQHKFQKIVETVRTTHCKLLESEELIANLSSSLQLSFMSNGNLANSTVSDHSSIAQEVAHAL
jgi:type I restriction enzyme S subunit